MSVKKIPLQFKTDIPPAGETEVVNPFDGSVIATLETAGEKHINELLETAKELYDDRAGWLTVQKRVEILERTASIISEREDDLIKQAAGEGGKPYNDSKVEIYRASDSAKIAAETIRTEAGNVIPMGGDLYSANRAAFTQKEPIGVVVAVSAFNHPLNLIVHQVGAAVAAGCPVIVKPAVETPLSCVSFKDILVEAGLPPEWCQVVITDSNDTAQALVTDERTAFFSFIGSSRVGWSLRSKLAPGTRCALEHGGVAPALVYPDADMERAAVLLAKGGFYHAGQVCVSTQRIYVQKKEGRRFVSLLQKEAQSLKVGDPALKSTQVGPLIRPSEVERVHKWVTQAVKEGAELVCGGKPVLDTCYEPTVLLNPSDKSLVSTEEIFGPVVCIYEVDDMEDAVARANGLDVAFQSSVFTSDIDTALATAKKLNASGVMVNDHTAFRIDGMPFAGLKKSGLGTGGIPHTIKDMSVEKMVVLRSDGI
ncbi:MAG: aldehyde dehydrogenase family protein [Candidatus Mycalebacterium zealandia]|nr:MAG: aldehyde dehydrogenase family protein [Candidatus Mycalebacterium zealandia]